MFYFELELHYYKVLNDSEINSSYSVSYIACSFHNCEVVRNTMKCLNEIKKKYILN